MTASELTTFLDVFQRLRATVVSLKVCIGGGWVWVCGCYVGVWVLCGRP